MGSKNFLKIGIAVAVVLVVGGLVFSGQTGNYKGSFKNLQKKAAPKIANCNDFKTMCDKGSKEACAALQDKCSPGAAARQEAENRRRQEQNEERMAEERQRQAQEQRAGTLEAHEEGSPDSGIVVAGKVNVVFSKYRFRATGEAFTLRKLDIVLDDNNDFSDDPSNDTGGNNVTGIGLEWMDNGVPQRIFSNINAGTARFDNLTILVTQDGMQDVSILVNINTVELGAISGSRFRLGLSEREDANNNFEAVGQSSAVTLSAPNGDRQTYGASNEIPFMTIRKTKPTVNKSADANTLLGNGTKEIAKINISADPHEAVALKQMKFEFMASPNLRVHSLELHRRIGNAVASNISNQVSIKKRDGQNVEAGGTNLSNQIDSIIVTWDRAQADQEFVARGVTNTYTILATVEGAIGGDALSTYIADDTDFVNGNAAEIMDHQPTPHFVWSDTSSPQHSVDTNDWTNGMDVENLPTSTQSLTF